MIAVLRPALPLQREHVQREEREDEARVIIQIAEVEHPAGDRFEARTGADPAQPAGHVVTDVIGREWTADHIEHPARDRRQDQADDLVVAACADGEADRDVRAAEQQRRHVATQHRTPIEIAEVSDGQR
jgi:hypothetical protein